MPSRAGIRIRARPFRHTSDEEKSRGGCLVLRFGSLGGFYGGAELGLGVPGRGEKMVGE